MGALGIVPRKAFLKFQLERKGVHSEIASKIANQSVGCETFSELLEVLE